ncbi:hypothetical protein FW781_10540 [Chryseobacterium panacisoli]|uniref:Uncharacterized protein n=1 Tax=Chryseobacterium panacisoli TaxID=1807141 RepID=A0A5D8ZMS1_9FLAO|nr:hypothetical protein [Chryseobacterium panacisoli]TZF95870.1 hypothetical protein FW781_10540 [Chryseobacterium panacisoli]
MPSCKKFVTERYSFATEWEINESNTEINDYFYFRMFFEVGTTDFVRKGYSHLSIKTKKSALLEVIHPWNKP